MFNFSKILDRTIVLLTVTIFLFGYILFPYVNADNNNPNINGDVLKCGTVCLPCVLHEHRDGGGIDPLDSTRCLDELIGYAYNTCQSPDPPNNSALCIEGDRTIVARVVYDWKTTTVVKPGCVGELISAILISGGTIGICAGACGTLLVPGCIGCLLVIAGESVNLDLVLIDCFEDKIDCATVTGNIESYVTAPVCNSN
jgi:hypothetical protein